MDEHQTSKALVPSSSPIACAISSRITFQLIHKVRHGASIEDAVEDIIQCGIGKLRKNAFGDDAEDAKNLPWAPEQAWAIFKRLAKDSEIPYHDVLLDFPFKGDETPLRSMEKSELISITTVNSKSLRADY